MGVEDPAGATEYLNPKGKRRHKPVDKAAQLRNYELNIDLRANEVFSVEPPSKSLPKKKKKRWPEDY